MEKEIKQIETEHQELVMKSREIQIVSYEALQGAVEFIKKIISAKKRVEEIRKFFTDPLNKQIKDINAKFKPYTEKLEIIEIEVRNKIVGYETEQEKKRKAEEERIRKEQEKKYKKQIEKAEKKGEIAPTPPPPIYIERKDVEGLGFRKVWDFEIEDIGRIPREFLMPDEKKIRKCINAGFRKIEGIRIFEKTISSISGKNEDDL